MPQDCGAESPASRSRRLQYSKAPNDAKVYTTEVVRAVNSCLKRVGQTLADDKTKTALITKREKKKIVKEDVGEPTATPKPAIKYLGAGIDAKLRKHLE